MVGFFKRLKSRITGVSDVPQVFVSGESNSLSDSSSNISKIDNNVDFCFDQILGSVEDLKLEAKDDLVLVKELNNLSVAVLSWRKNFFKKNINVGKIKKFVNVTINDKKGKNFYNSHKEQVMRIKVSFRTLFVLSN